MMNRGVLKKTRKELWSLRRSKKINLEISMIVISRLNLKILGQRAMVTALSDHTKINFMKISKRAIKIR